MFKIAGTLPVKTRLPFVAWALAGLVTIFSLVTSFEIPTFNHAEQADTSGDRGSVRLYHGSAQSTGCPLTTVDS